ncbi:MAG: PD-(D/E)XK nuclease family protein, partial [Rhodobacterales bacterium]
LDASAVIAEVTALLTTPEVSHIFASQALAEVAVSATVPDLEGRRIQGTIDRLLVNRDEVLAVDFKSNAAVPSDVALCPEGILRQMAAYSAALKQIYPDKIIKISILWTKTATLMPLCDSALRAALTRAQVPPSDW